MLANMHDIREVVDISTGRYEKVAYMNTHKFTCPWVIMYRNYVRKLYLKSGVGELLSKRKFNVDNCHKLRQKELRTLKDFP
jgi:hypothetical protein